MRTHHPQPVFQVPRAVGRTEGDLTAKGADYAEQLHLFREVLTRPAKLQLLAMMALSDPKHLDKPSTAKIADIADTMGYERRDRADGKRSYAPDLYQRIEEVGMRLRRREVELLVREYHRVRDGRPKGTYRRVPRTSLISMTVLQEFGFYYEDEDGQPVQFDQLPSTEQDHLIAVEPKPTKSAAGSQADAASGLLKYDAIDGGQPIWAIPMLDDQGRIIRNVDGSPRRRPANGLTWRWSSRFADLARNQGTAWWISLDGVQILQKYLSKPITFDLIWISLFHRSGLIEFGRDKLVEHLGIKGTRNVSRVNDAIAGAFNDLLAEGIIDQLPTIREQGYYQPTKKTNRPRRVGMVYQWRLGKRWSSPGDVIDVSPSTPEGQKDGGT